MLLRDIIRSLPSGAPIAPGTTVNIYRESDDALLDSVATDANGMFEYTVAGNPGAVRYECVVGAGTKVHSTRSILPVSDLDLSGLRPLLHTFLDGVVVNYKDALVVTADGLSMQVEVGPGVATARGVIYRQDGTEIAPIPAVTANPRIDTLVVRFWKAESGDNVGRCELLRLEGTEAVTPVAPVPADTTDYFDTPLAQVRVDVGAIGIALGKVTDSRLISIPFIPNGTISKDQLATDVAFGIPYVKDGHTTVVLENADRLNFNNGLVAAVNGSIATQVDVDLDYGATGTSAKVSRDDHTHTVAIMDDALIAGQDISASVDIKNPTTLTLPAVKCKVRVRVYLRSASLTGGPVNGSIWVNIAGAKKKALPFQSDGGVDSLLFATGAYETSGGTSLAISWGITLSGPIRSTGGYLEWEVIPVR